MQWLTVLPLEIIAASLTIRYWTDQLPSAIFVTLFLYYRMENARRDRIEKQEALEDDTGVARVTTDEAWAGLTDRQNKRFRYVY